MSQVYSFLCFGINTILNVSKIPRQWMDSIWYFHCVCSSCDVWKKLMFLA